MLGGGEPIRVRQGQRVLFRIVNASATLQHQLALPGHRSRSWRWMATRSRTQRTVPMVELAPGERVDALVTMDAPGVWVLGGVKTASREAGLGIVVEYAGAPARPAGNRRRRFAWDYSRVWRPHAGAGAGRATDAGVSGARRWPSLDDQRQVVSEDRPDRRAAEQALSLGARQPERRSASDPSASTCFELVRMVDKPTSGVWKDVVVVPAWKQVEIDVPATQAGLSLLHCHQQFHMDMGFMTLLRYA